MNLANPSTIATTREPARRLLIVGASARAAAASATRAGLTPQAIDRFDDSDLGELCEQRRIYRRASDIPRLADELPDGDWIYTGPFENHPRVLQLLGAKRRLLGNDFETVKQVRDPWRVHDCLHDAGLASPCVCRSVAEVSAGRWLKKPLRSGGGCGIKECRTEGNEAPVEVGNPGSPTKASARGSYYYQRYIAGTSYSAIFVGAHKHAALLGVTEQLIGTTWNAVSAYQYAGSIGPVTLPSAAEPQLRGLGATLSERFELQGLFGVDFILAEDNIWPVEVNPRYTASVEVIEIATKLSLLESHVQACLNQHLPSVKMREPSLIAGKLILYAKQAMEVSESEIELIAKRVAEEADGVIADSPRAGTKLLPGDPICTVLVTAATVEDVRRRLGKGRWVK